MNLKCVSLAYKNNKPYIYFALILTIGLFGGRGRGMTGPGRGQQQQQQQPQQDKKPGKPQGMKNQHWQATWHNSTNAERLLLQYMKIKSSLVFPSAVMFIKTDHGRNNTRRSSKKLCFCTEFFFFFLAFFIITIYKCISHNWQSFFSVRLRCVLSQLCK